MRGERSSTRAERITSTYAATPISRTLTRAGAPSIVFLNAATPSSF